jgi:BirA family transcriptional regulator, biotin operon repressor / biotin---[acetyl-CoA-carboxylase] ligase
MDNSALLSALVDGPKTGVELADMLGVSRAAVWKRIEHLRLQGLAIEAVEHQGYALPHATALLNAERILEAMPAAQRRQLTGLHIDFEIESTQRQALLHAAPEQGIEVWLAESQSAGQGRRGKLWQSPPLSNIYCSLNRRFACSIAALSGLSLAVAVMLTEALQAFSAERFSVKWPNDIWLDGRKCAGLLIQVRGEAGGPCEVTVGFGVNVLMSEQAGRGIDQPWTALARHSAHALDRNLILAKLLDAMLTGFEHYEADGLPGFIERWRALDGLNGKSVVVMAGATHVDGVARGIDAEGALLVERGGETLRCHSGEVSVRVAHG